MLPYDSDEGRNLAASLTAVMCGQAYVTSAEVAAAMGPFSRYRMNRKPFLEVIGMHKAAAETLPRTGVPEDLQEAARTCWREAFELGQKHGYKNAQVTVLAPTGTIAFMMDCDTTGVEPDLALVKTKQLADGGTMKIVNQTIPQALNALGYDATEVRETTAYVDAHETIEGAPGLRDSSPNPLVPPILRRCECDLNLFPWV